MTCRLSFLRLFTFFNFQNIQNFKAFELPSTFYESSVLSVLGPGLLPWHTSNNISEKEVWMVILKIFLHGRYCSLAYFSRIYLTLPREEAITMRQFTVFLRNRGFRVMVMESTDALRIHLKENILFCKEWCVYCSYTHWLSKRKRNSHFVCVPLWL